MDSISGVEVVDIFFPLMYDPKWRLQGAGGLVGFCQVIRKCVNRAGSDVRTVVASPRKAGPALQGGEP